MEDVDDKFEQFKTIRGTYEILSQFWRGVFNFQSYLRQQYKEQVYRISLGEF